MTFSIEYVLYIYLFISVCLIIFNIMNIGGRKLNNKRQQKLTKKYLNMIIEEINSNKYNENHYKLLCNKLKHISQLTAFNAAITELLKYYEKETRNYLKNYKDVFNYLAQIYRDKSTIYRAYFAYLMSVYKLCTSTSSNYITETMLLFIKDSSLYVRENAMKAIISFKNPENILLALKNINKLEYDYQKKVLTDDLLEYTGDKDELCLLLFDSLHEFREEIQLGIINYITYVSNKFNEKFYNIINKKCSKNVKIAIIRYYAKNYYEPIIPILYKYLNSKKINDWELAAVSAFALKNYKSLETKEELMRSLTNSNWYVRKNSATSLINIGLNKDDVKKLKLIEDKYARETLAYQLTKELSKEMKNEC